MGMKMKFSLRKRKIGNPWHKNALEYQPAGLVSKKSVIFPRHKPSHVQIVSQGSTHPNKEKACFRFINMLNLRGYFLSYPKGPPQTPGKCFLDNGSITSIEFRKL